ncbi:hypothetical protein [Rossellomorea arthrocnemi]|nr:hypothetical protein [Rossellomorea arthrocnemi]
MNRIEPEWIKNPAVYGHKPPEMIKDPAEIGSNPAETFNIQSINV